MSPPDERKEGDAMYVTYQDLIQIGILVVALANLIYQVYKGITLALFQSRFAPSHADYNRHF